MGTRDVWPDAGLSWRQIHCANFPSEILLETVKADCEWGMWQKKGEAVVRWICSFLTKEWCVWLLSRGLTEWNLIGLLEDRGINIEAKDIGNRRGGTGYRFTWEIRIQQGRKERNLDCYTSIWSIYICGNPGTYIWYTSVALKFDSAGLFSSLRRRVASPFSCLSHKHWDAWYAIGIVLTRSRGLSTECRLTEGPSIIPSSFNV